MINFDVAALDWYRAKEERESFANWKDLQLRLSARFQSTRKGSICGQFLAIKDETTIEEHQNYLIN